MMHLCLITILIAFQKVLSAGSQPTFRYQQDDIFEERPITMICNVKNTPCNQVPPYVYLEKQISQMWYNACKITTDDTYEAFPMIDGNNVEGRGGVFYLISNKEYYFSLNHTNLKDNGKWRCTLRDCDDAPIPSNDEPATVSTNLTPSEVYISAPAYIILNYTSEYKCTSDRVYPEVNVSWTKDGELSQGIPNNKFNGEFWEMENTNTFRFCDRSTPEITCTLEKTSGSNPWSVPNTLVATVPFFAPAVIEDFTAIEKSINISETLIIPCTASGTSRTITWFKDGAVLNVNGLFERNDVVETGDYACGETEATKSSLTWIHIDNPTCANVNRHEGKYMCVVNAVKNTTARSDEKNVTVLYPPFVAYSSVIVNASIDDVITLTCHVDCAMPEDLTYSWIRDDNKEDIGENTPSIDITITEQDFNTAIRCTVNNDVGTNFIRFIIFEKKFPETTTSTDQPPDTTRPYDTEPTTDSEEPKSPNQALVTAFAVIWSLCGAFAILLVCLALYHYRQIQNGKTYKGEYSEELVLTEDEAQPGTSQVSCVYDDISPVVVAKGAMGGVVGGISNAGLYAEVQRPAQTQIPVAPNRTSKIQASQPNPGTPKRKRNQAPTAPKSPINGLHNQPHSLLNDRRPEPKADYSLVTKTKEIQPQHSIEGNRGPASKTEQHQKRHESPNKTAVVKQTTNGAKPSIPFKPNITSVRSSTSSAAGAPYDNAEVNVYANCDQRPIQKNDDGTITYADLDLQKEDTYNEGAPPVPVKNMNDQEPVQYASIKHGK